MQCTKKQSFNRSRQKKSHIQAEVEFQIIRYFTSTKTLGRREVGESTKNQGRYKKSEWTYNNE